MCLRYQDQQKKKFLTFILAVFESFHSNMRLYESVKKSSQLCQSISDCSSSISRLALLAMRDQIQRDKLISLSFIAKAVLRKT